MKAKTRDSALEHFHPLTSKLLLTLPTKKKHIKVSIMVGRHLATISAIMAISIFLAVYLLKLRMKFEMGGLWNNVEY